MKQITSSGYRLLKWAFIVCFILMGLILGWNSGRFWAFVVVAGSFSLFYRWPRIPLFTLILFFVAFAVNLVWVFVADPEPISDFGLLFEAAKALLAGETDVFSTQYFVLWSYQIPFVILEALLLKVWNTPLFIQIFNSLCTAGSICLIYRLLRGWVSDAPAKTTAVCLIFFPTISAMPSVLTNQCSAAFFLILGVWLVCSKDAARLRFARYGLAGLAIQIGNLLRPEGIIVAVALVAYGIFYLFKNPERVKHTAFAAALLTIIYLAGGVAADQIVIRTGLSPYGVENQLPQWKYVCGTNFETVGRYAASDFELISATLGEDWLPTEETDAVVHQIMSQRLKRPLDEWWEMLTTKQKKFWQRSGAEWAFFDLSKQSEDFQTKVRPVLEERECELFYLMLILSLVGLLKKKEPVQFIPYFVFFASFFAFLLIEVQPRYTYFPDFFLFTAGAYGFEVIECILKKGNAVKTVDSGSEVA